MTDGDAHALAFVGCQINCHTIAILGRAIVLIPMFALLLDDISITQQAPSAIDDIHVSDGKIDNSWYDLQGRRYTERPTTAGVYINNGKKYIIK